MLRTRTNPVQISTQVLSAKMLVMLIMTNKSARRIWVLIEMGCSGFGDTLRHIPSVCFAQHSFEADSLCSCHG